MLALRKLYNFLDTLFFSLWGITLIDVFPNIDAGFLSSIDGKIKIVFTFLGLIYFAMKIVFFGLEKIVDWKIKKIDQESKELDLKKKRND